MRRSGLFSLIFIVLVAGLALTGVLVTDKSPQLGLDLQGGASVVLKPKNPASDEALKQAREIIRSRVDALGVAEPAIRIEGSNIVVELPGVKDQQRALSVVGRTAELRFRPVAGTIPAGVDLSPSSTATDDTGTTAPGDTGTTAPGDTSTSAPADSSTTATTAADEQGFRGGLSEGELAAPLVRSQDTTTTTAATSTTAAGDTTTTAPGDTSTTSTTTGSDTPAADADCPNQTAADDDKPETAVILPGKDTDDDGKPELCYSLGPVPTNAEGDPLVGSEVKTARAQLVGAGSWVVSLEMRGKGIDLFNQIAQSCFNADQNVCPSRQLAIVLDGVVESAPVIQPENNAFEPFRADQISISGGASSGFSEREAKDLALVLRFGALPVELEPETVQTVSATLGRDSLDAGLAAGFLGVALVALYMFLYYRALGMVVVLGLCVWSALNYSIISYLGSTQGLALSLAGVTGIIVSVGVTVDSYVVYFERLKDEIRSGKTIRSSVDRGFQRAFRTILAADFSSFIGAALLYWLTVGPVRGFAFFLGLSTILDVVVAYTFTRPLVALLGRSRFFTQARWVGVARGLGVEQAPSTPAPVVAGGGR